MQNQQYHVISEGYVVGFSSCY